MDVQRHRYFVVLPHESINVTFLNVNLKSPFQTDPTSKDPPVSSRILLQQTQLFRCDMFSVLMHIPEYFGHLKLHLAKFQVTGVRRVFGEG